MNLLLADMNRRSVLAVGGAMLSTALAGCSALGGGSDPDPTIEPFRLGRVELENTLQTVQSIGLRVYRDGERVHDRAYRLEAAPTGEVTSTVAPTDEFGCQLGVYTVSACLNEGRWSYVEIPAQYHGHWIELAVEEHGNEPTAVPKIELKELGQWCPETTA